MLILWSRRGVSVSATQPRPDAGAGPGVQGEQGAVPQGEAAAQREDQQRGPGARPVAERLAADPHLCLRLQDHERVPHEEGTVHDTDMLMSNNTDHKSKCKMNMQYRPVHIAHCTLTFLFSCTYYFY